MVTSGEENQTLITEKLLEWKKKKKKNEKKDRFKKDGNIAARKEKEGEKKMKDEGKTDDVGKFCADGNINTINGRICV